ncbi:Nn.00g030110.m01.CDS01 [Neocucurbitaria sp. VM-36]
MSGNSLYNPDQAAVDTRWIQPWSEAFRAQRDVGLRVPIDFHTVPAVALKQACFGNNQYEHNAFQTCFSNLLGVGFRRFAVDVYWDPLRTEWSLCPVEQPESNTDDEQPSIASGPTVAVSTATASAKPPESTPVQPRGFALRRRQGTSETASAVVETTTTPPLSAPSSTSSTNPAARPTIISFPTTSGPPLMQIGSYNCTSLMTLGLLTGLLADFMDVTATTTGASVTLLEFNVHAASSLIDPDGPAPLLSQDQLPEAGTLLSDILKGNLSDDTYTPSHLQDQRANLNDSWYDVDWNNRPAQGYYQSSPNANGRLITSNGWPSEAFMEFQELYRLVISFGTIDPQMQYYNIGLDFNYIFPPGTLAEVVKTSIDSDGRVSSGCLFAPSENALTSGTNSSWAISTAASIDIDSNPDLMAPIPSIANLTSCGLSPFLNQSLANTTADKNPLPYAAFVHSSLWSWAPGEPLNTTSNDPNATGDRCVVMTVSPYPGRWRVTDCADRYRVACQDPSQPYNWQVSSDSIDYAGAAFACPLPYQFSIPHTALENAHLLAALQSHRQSVPTDDAIFLDLNQLSVPDCWVIGINGTCPYLSRMDTDQTRIVVVPTVAAVIIFVLAALTFFVKCAANRREDKRGRRRRMVGGWEYEGVPS